jgi:tetratricopeptide (TPR) repeat protein
MIEPPYQDDGLRRLAITALVISLIGAAVAVVFGVVQIVQQSAVAGIAFVAGGLLAAWLGVLLLCQVLLIHKFVGYAFRVHGTLLELSELIRRGEENTRLIADNSNLSDLAKRIVYREKEFEFLRDTILAAIVRQDWQAAEHLIRDVDAQFGYHDEATALRDKLEKAQRATTEERVAAALARFEVLCEQHKWDQAISEWERLKMLFPGNPTIERLPHEIEQRRQGYKQQLLKEYDQAVRNQDIERAHRLLFALDQYLVAKEAEALKASARGVFRARMEQIRTQFTIAVQYKQFPNAIEAGERLIREFPNSGYAQEISKLLPILRKRASGQLTPTADSGSGSTPS